MKKIKIILDNVNNIQKFCKIVSSFENDIDLISGKYIVDAKSIMGIFCLDLTKPVTLEIYGNHGERVEDALSDFLLRT